MPVAQDAVWLDVLPSMKNFGSELAKGAGSEADKQGKSVGKRFGASALIGIGVVAGGAAVAGKALYAIGETFDKVTDTIRVGTGATGKDLDKLVASAKNVGAQVPASFEDIGTVVADVNTRLGLTGSTLEKFSSQALEAGRIMGEEIDINAMSSAFSAFKIEGEATTDAMDRLFQVSQATGVGMNDLAKQTAANAPAMQALGFSFEETAGMVGALDKAGLNSSKTMNGMSKALVTLAKDGEEPKEAFKRVTEEMQGFIDKGDDAAALDLASELFGTRNATQFVGALKSGKINMEDLGNVAGMTGDTILEAGKDTADFAEKWQIVKNRALLAVAPVAERVFGAMADGADMLLEKVIPAAEKFVAEWDRGVGAGGRFRDILTGVKDALAAVGGFLVQHRQVVAALVVGYTAYRAAMVATAAVTRAMTAATTIYHGVQKAVQVGQAAWEAGKYSLAAAQRVYTATVNGGTGAVKANTIAEKLGLVAGKAKLVLTNAMTVAQRALNAVMRMNPIGLVITAITALVAILVIAYNKHDGFRALVQRVWAAIKSAAASVVDWFKNTAWPAMKTALEAIGNAAKWLWSNAIKPAFNAIWGIAKSVFGWIANTGWPLLKTAFNAMGSVVSWLWNNIYQPYFTKIWGIAKSVFGWIKDTGWPWVKTALSAIGSAAATLWSKWIKPNFDRIKGGAERLVSAFESARDGIGRAFSSLKDKIAGPIQTTLSWINSNFIGPLNNMLSKVGAGFRIPTLGGGGGPAKTGSRSGLQLATGGPVGGWSPSPTADNIPAWLTAGEYVLPVKAVAQLTRTVGARGLEMLRRGNLPGYAMGGKVGGLNPAFRRALDAFNAAAGGRFSVISGLRSRAQQEYLYNLYLSGRGNLAARPGTSRHESGNAADLSPSSARDTHGALARKFGLHFPVPGEAWHVELLGGGGGGGGGFVGAVKKVLSGLAGRVLGGGKAVIHALLDKMPSQPAPWMPAGKGAARQSVDAIFDQFMKYTGGYVPDGKPGGYAHGGIVRPAVFDQGGTLAPGLNLVHNKLGRPEPLVRADLPHPGLDGARFDLVVEDGTVLRAYVRSQASAAARADAAASRSRLPVGGAL